MSFIILFCCNMYYICILTSEWLLSSSLYSSDTDDIVQTRNNTIKILTKTPENYKVIIERILFDICNLERV